MGLIYKAISPVNKCYIGKTIKLFVERKSEHEKCAFNENSHVYNTKFSRALRKYGIENFKWEILFQGNIDENDLYKMEKNFIKENNSLQNGYNCTLGGEGVSKGNVPWNKGKKGLQISANKGKKLTKEQKRIISEKTKKAMCKDGLQEKILISKGCKYFNVYEKNTEKYIGTWLNQKECARILNCCQSLINKCLKNERNSHNGYIFSYKEDLH